ncbi:MAG: hypothetical protein KA911_06440 [Xanthomonadales bacterium]|nr:hypothetical protein [Xanthomonadales bacterium]MBP7418221.1 hypothetical protein [Xanthomonadales bacterium]HQX24393.1 hypothetical protein [Pseudomonadota bacterium]HRA36223.1 hypothetical protein [Pseudomonadota bacterium]
MRSAPPIALELRPSRRFELALLAAIVAALAACAYSGLPMALQLAAGVLVLLLGAHAARVQRAQAGLRLAIERDGAAVLRTRGGDDQALRVAAWACRGPLVTLRLAGAGVSRNLFLLPDSADADALRRLRVRLAQLDPPDRVRVG